MQRNNVKLNKEAETTKRFPVCICTYNRTLVSAVQKADKTMEYMVKLLGKKSFN